jgi:Malectin domain
MLIASISGRWFCGLAVATAIVFSWNIESSLAQSAKESTDAAKSTSDSLPTIRMRAGSRTPYKDSEGNTWLPDVASSDGGFEGGEIVDRPDDIAIKNTKEPGLYRSEHWGMESFSYKLPNGKYVVKLHFAETYEGIGGPGERVFSFKVQDKEFSDFDVWQKAGGRLRAYVEKVPVEVTDGKLKITFTVGADSPEINGIEIIPAAKYAAMETAPAADKSPAK